MAKRKFVGVTAIMNHIRLSGVDQETAAVLADAVIYSFLRAQGAVQMATSFAAIKRIADIENNIMNDERVYQAIYNLAKMDAENISFVNKLRAAQKPKASQKVAAKLNG